MTKPKEPSWWCLLRHRVISWPGGLHCWDWRCEVCGKKGWYSDD